MLLLGKVSRNAAAASLVISCATSAGTAAAPEVTS